MLFLKIVSMKKFKRMKRVPSGWHLPMTSCIYSMKRAISSLGILSEMIDMTFCEAHRLYLQGFTNLMEF